MAQTAKRTRKAATSPVEVVQATKPALQTTTSLTPASSLGLSDEQAAIAMFIKDGSGNLLVRARAGTGKTYLIRKCIPLMNGKIAVAAFNNKIASEIRLKLQADGTLRSYEDRQKGRDGVDVGTFHSYGFQVLRMHLKGIRIEGRSGPDAAGFYKFDLIAERLQIPTYLKSLVRKAMERAQERLFGVKDLTTGKPIIAFSDQQAWLDLAAHYGLEEDLPPDDNIELQLLMRQLGRDATIEDARQAMLRKGLSLAARSIQMGIRMATEKFHQIKTIGRGATARQVKGPEFTGVISFSDMLYLPLYFGMPMPQYDWVCVDEAQDSNPSRREMAKRMLKPTGRMLWVGDDRQAIYGWSGADNDALDQIIAEFRCKVFPMTVTFRCGKAIVELAKTIVPDYKAADTNPEGKVSTISEEDFHKVEMRIGEDAVICRNTAPLVKVAYKLIGRGVACHVEGKDIGKGLTALIYRWPHLKNIGPFVDKLTEYRDKETTKLLEKKQESAAEALSDRVETVLAIIEFLPKDSKVADIQAHVEKLFVDTKDGDKPTTVALMTVHRSKGLEFDRVFGWGVDKYMPSKFAKQDWQQVQEDNLTYVLYSRAISEFVNVAVA